MIGYATLLRDLGTYEQSRTYFLRGLAILEKKSGADHLINTPGMNELGGLLNLMGKPAEAVPLLERTLAIEEKAYGPDHVDLAFVLNNLAVSRAALGDLAAARKLYERAIAIAVTVYGEDHPEVARILSGYAGLLFQLGEKQLAFDAAVRTEQIGRAHVALTIRSLPERQALLCSRHAARRASMWRSRSPPASRVAAQARAGRSGPLPRPGVRRDGGAAPCGGSFARRGEWAALGRALPGARTAFAPRRPGSGELQGTGLRGRAGASPRGE